jgi:hypothetical protein
MLQISFTHSDVYYKETDRLTYVKLTALVTNALSLRESKRKSNLSRQMSGMMCRCLMLLSRHCTDMATCTTPGSEIGIT